jgi:hypothetical protein
MMVTADIDAGKLIAFIGCMAADKLLFDLTYDVYRRKIMEFSECLDKIWNRISDEDFLANRGVANEVRYYVFDYEPCYELIIRAKIKSLKKQNNPDADGFQIVEYYLYEMVLQILEEKGYIDMCIKFEGQKEWSIYIQQLPKFFVLLMMTKYSYYDHSMADETPLQEFSAEEIENDLERLILWLDDVKKRQKAV